MVRRCSVCGSEGHNRRSCREAREEAQAEATLARVEAEQAQRRGVLERHNRSRSPRRLVQSQCPVCRAGPGAHCARRIYGLQGECSVCQETTSSLAVLPCGHHVCLSDLSRLGFELERPQLEFELQPPTGRVTVTLAYRGRVSDDDHISDLLAVAQFQPWVVAQGCRERELTTPWSRHSSDICLYDPFLSRDVKENRLPRGDGCVIVFGAGHDRVLELKDVVRDFLAALREMPLSRDVCESIHFLKTHTDFPLCIRTDAVERADEIIRTFDQHVQPI